MRLSSVVLPAPLPPSRQVIVPAWSEKSTASRTCFPGKLKESFSAVNTVDAWFVIQSKLSGVLKMPSASGVYCELFCYPAQHGDIPADAVPLYSKPRFLSSGRTHRSAPTSMRRNFCLRIVPLHVDPSVRAEPGWRCRAHRLWRVPLDCRVRQIIHFDPISPYSFNKPVMLAFVTKAPDP